jgi:hypothetical protein
MISRFTAKGFAGLSLLGAVAFSQADTFSVVEAGTWAPSGLNVASSFTTSMTIASSISPSGVTGGTISLTEAAPPTPGGVAANGTLTMFGPTAADTLVFNFSGTVYSGATLSLAASSALTTSSGVYSGYHFGTGNLAFQFLTIPGASYAVGTVSADVEPTPEPLSLAALGLGLVGFIARKRRS